MQLNPRLLVNLLAKLTKNEPLMGAMGGGAPLCQFQLPVWVRGIHSGEARTLRDPGLVRLLARL